MAKFLRSMTSSSARYGRSMDANMSHAGRPTGYGRIGPDGSFEAVTNPSFVFRVSRKVRIMKLGSRVTGPGRDGKAPQPSSTFLGRLRVAYERLMLKAGGASGEFTAIPVAKAARAPPALSSVVSTWIVASGSRKGAKISDLDPGFKLTAVEKKYLRHLTRTASVR